MALSPLQLLARRPILNTASSSSLGRFAGRRTAAAAGSSSLASHRLQQRWLSSSGAAATGEPLADPLHYHPLPADSPRLLALSFIDRPPISAQSRTTIGHLPLFADGREPSLADFVENAAFKDVLHEAIREAINEGDERIVAEAQGRVEGWINLTGQSFAAADARAGGRTGGPHAPRRPPRNHRLPGLDGRDADSSLTAPPDDRNPGLPSRVGDADDLIGSFYVTEGKVRPPLRHPRTTRSVTSNLLELPRDASLAG
jgi:hypothetical protein